MSEVVNGTPYQNFIHVSRYARWIEEQGRRETWGETVDRYINFMRSKVGDKYEDDEVFKEVRKAIFNLEVLPSMRALMTAGPALERDNIAGYNCSFIAVDHPRAFDEALYILCNGTGVGFSVEKEFVDKLPEISESFFPTDTKIVVHDSKLGWAKAFKELIVLLYTGQVPTWDTSAVRPAGERLKVFGGRASGPEPLEDLFRFTINTFKNAAGRRLTPLEAHDIMCKVGDIVVVGGVRRAALISFSDLGDFEMAKAKSGRWWEEAGQRALANNTAVYKGKPNTAQFLREWRNLYESKSGERGMTNLNAIKSHFKKFGRREWRDNVRSNPCHEIFLRSNQFCNLTEVVVSPDDTEETLREKVRLATILGTWQSTLTDFKYIRKQWKANTEEERLLGVSMTGIFGNPLLYNVSDDTKGLLDSLREFAVKTNKEESEALGIPQSVSVTCNKPSGTTSQLTLTSSGIHPWYSQYYIRRVRSDNKDPLAEMLKDAGVPWEADVTKPNEVSIFSFAIKAPEDAVVQSDLTAVEHLEVWKMYREHWAEHNPSVTISVNEDEWLDVGAWVYKNFDYIGGVSFLPAVDHVYQQAPYEAITKEAYEELLEKTPEIYWDALKMYEVTDNTTGTQELACTAGNCEV